MVADGVRWIAATARPFNREAVQLAGRGSRLVAHANANLSASSGLERDAVHADRSLRRWSSRAARRFMPRSRAALAAPR
jgi:hypothetical protein